MVTSKLKMGVKCNWGADGKLNDTKIQTRWKIIISNDDYEAYIAYIILDNGEAKIIHANIHTRSKNRIRVIDHKHPDLQLIISTILPSI